MTAKPRHSSTNESGPHWWDLTLTMKCLSSPPEDPGVEDLSLSRTGTVRLGLSVNLSLESEWSEPKLWVMESLFFWRWNLLFRRTLVLWKNLVKSWGVQVTQAKAKTSGKRAPIDRIKRYYPEKENEWRQFRWASRAKLTKRFNEQWTGPDETTIETVWLRMILSKSSTNESWYWFLLNFILSLYAYFLPLMFILSLWFRDWTRQEVITVN